MNRNTFISLHTGLLRLQRYLMGFATAAVAILIFTQVFIRYFLDIPLYGVEEISAYLAVWLYFIGSGYGVYQGNHISASVMDLILKSERARDAFHIVVTVITLVLIGWMFSICFDYFQWSLKRTPKSPELRLPLFYVHAAMVAGLGLMLFYSTIELVRRVMLFRQGQAYVSLVELDRIRLAPARDTDNEH